MALIATVSELGELVAQMMLQLETLMKELRIVQDDFQLICWDIVSEPSTPGAFVMKEGRDLSAEEIRQSREGARAETTPAARGRDAALPSREDPDCGGKRPL